MLETIVLLNIFLGTSDIFCKQNIKKMFRWNKNRILFKIKEVFGHLLTGDTSWTVLIVNVMNSTRYSARTPV